MVVAGHLGVHAPLHADDMVAKDQDPDQRRVPAMRHRQPVDELRVAVVVLAAVCVLAVFAIAFTIGKVMW